MESKGLTFEVFLAVVSVVSCCSNPFYPYGVMRGDTQLKTGDEEIFPIEMDTMFDFCGNQYDKLYLHFDGFIAFEDGTLPSYAETTPGDKPYAAVFWIDIFLKGEDTGRLYYRKVNVTEEPDIAALVESDSEAIGEGFTPKVAFIATWEEVLGNFGRRALTNSFQLVFATNGTTSITVFNYRETMVLNQNHLPGVQFNKGNGQWAKYPVSQTAAVSKIGTFSNMNFRGRIVTRVNGNIQLPNLSEVRCKECRKETIGGIVGTFDGSRRLKINMNERTYLLSKKYEGDKTGELDPCRFMLRIATDQNGKIKQLFFSVGIISDDDTRYKQTYVITVNGSTMFITRGGGRESMTFFIMM